MDSLAPFRTYFRWAALGCSAASAVLTFYFGLHQNPNWALAFACAVFLVSCSIASDYVILFITDAMRRRDYAGLVLMVIGGAFVFSLNLMSNLGSVGWQKDVTITLAKVHNVKFDDQRKTISDAEARIAKAEVRLSDLIQANGWAASVPVADALRAKLTAAQKAIDLETSHGGCKAKCLTLMQDKANLEARIATVETRSKLQTEIDNARAEIAVLRSKAVDSKREIAAADSQANFFAGLITANLEPSDTTKQWTSIGMSGWLALGLCIAPILFSFIGWRTDANATQDVARETVHSPATIAPVVGNAEVFRAIRDSVRSSGLRVA